MNHKIKIYISFLLGFIFISCSPYRGFSGVTDKGMKRNKLPSQELREDYEKMNRKARRAYKRQKRKTKKRLGTNEGRNSTRFSSD